MNRKKAFRSKIILVILTLTQILLSQNSNWSRYRGPNGSGISTTTGIPSTWSDKDYLWQLKLPGRGHSSPIVWQETVYVTCADEDNTKGYLLALNAADGTEKWRQSFPIYTDKMHNSNSLATSTPSADKDHVYSLWYSDESVFLMAFDHAGKLAWKAEFEGVFTRHGAGSSPVVLDGAVVFTREQELDGPYKSSWVAVECKTGKVRWELERKTVTSNSFATPCVYNDSKETPQLLFMSESHGMTVVNVKTGQVTWEEMVTDARAIASPQLYNDILVATCKGLEFVLRLNENKTYTKLYEKKRSQAPYLPSPLIKDVHLYNVLDNGNIVCLELESGKELWKVKPAGQIYGSPVWIEGKLYVISKKGQALVLDAETGKLLSQVPLGDNSQSTPAVSDGRIFLKTETRVFAIGKNKAL